jgi:beta-glucanase (GH16 family)
MEHKGNEPNVIHDTLHYPGRFWRKCRWKYKTITNAATEFHVYKTIWPTNISIYVDDKLFHTVKMIHYYI